MVFERHIFACVSSLFVSQSTVKSSTKLTEVFRSLSAMDATMDSDDEVSQATTTSKDPNLVKGAGINYTIVPGVKKNTTLVKFQGYLYRRRGPKIGKYQDLTYLRCRHMTRKEEPCPAAAEIRSKFCTIKDPIKNPHTCGPPETALARTEAHELKTVMKRRAKKEGTALKVSILVKSC